MSRHSGDDDRNPIRIVAGKEKHLRGRASPDPGHLDQLGRGLFGQLLQVDVVGLDLFIKGQPTSGERAQAGLSRSRGRDERACSQRRDMTDQRHFTGEFFQPFS